MRPIADQIARQWNHPSFRLAGQFPWITEVNAQLVGDAPFELERTKLEIIWRHAAQLSQQYDSFSFEAVVLYLIRWEVVYRWTRRDETAGQEKFEQLVSEAMGEFADLFSS